VGRYPEQSYDFNFQLNFLIWLSANTNADFKYSYLPCFKWNFVYRKQWRYPQD